MIFSELYSAYYNAIACVISEVIQGRTDEKNLSEAIMRHAFSESVLTIMPALKSGKWQLVKNDMTTPVRHIPSMPMTLLEKRWLRAISLDPRIRLFDLQLDGLDGIDPLFTPDDYVIYDRYADGDPYHDEKYVTHFRTVLEALRTKQPLKIEMINRRGRLIAMKVMPARLEYSEKDDKFRLISTESRYGNTINLARMISCRICGDKIPAPIKEEPLKHSTVTLKIQDERNALERCMLHFAHFEKQAERIDDRNYLVHINYLKNDETEMVIRILGFGPLVEVIEPTHFRNLIIERLKKQKSCELF